MAIPKGLLLHPNKNAQLHVGRFLWYFFSLTNNKQVLTISIFADLKK
jgi:hypothetical protein